MAQEIMIQAWYEYYLSRWIIKLTIYEPSVCQAAERKTTGKLPLLSNKQMISNHCLDICNMAQDVL